jgi:hypothetical protein
MTISNPPVAFPGTRPGRDMTGRPLAAGLVLIMSRPAAPSSGHSSQPAPPRWPGDRSGLWLRNAAAGLCVLARPSPGSISPPPVPHDLRHQPLSGWMTRPGG